MTRFKSDEGKSPAGCHQLRRSPRARTGYYRPRDGAKRLESEMSISIGIARVPSGIFDVVVTNIGGIPAEDDVAESKSALQSREKLVFVDIFTPKNSVDIGYGTFTLVASAALTASMTASFVHSPILIAPLQPECTIALLVVSRPREARQLRPVARLQRFHYR